MQQGSASPLGYRAHLQHRDSNSSLRAHLSPSQAQQEFSSLDIGPPSPATSAHTPDRSPEESFEVVKNYETQDPVLPTSSPRPEVSYTDFNFGSYPALNSRAGSRVVSSGGALPSLTVSSARNRNLSANTSFGSMAATTPQSAPSPFSAPRRYVSDTYDSYSSTNNNHGGGEDKMAEKAKANLQPFSEKASFGGGAKYAKLIPEQKPPQSPAEYVQWFFRNEHCMVGMYTALSLFTRLWKIGKNGTVVWDEAHFGKFGSHYLKHEFYFDVHPPLGKMLVGLAGLLSGYNGQFEFKSGDPYPDDVNYVGMRVILAMFGVAMVPVAWSTSGVLGWDWRTRHALAIMVLLDNAWLVISRFILLDSMLLCFTFTTFHGLVMFHHWRHESFSDRWWFWLTFTGVSIGCVASVKWVGLFVTALVGLYTVEDLWDKFGDLKMPVRRYARHWCARILCLIVLPLAIYMASFKMHFMILSHSGPGDAQMSSLFQAHLKGNTFAQAPLEAAYGSVVTFKNMGYGGGLLHSHIQTYPVGSQQQQVTCYHYRDNNNDFILKPTWEDRQLREDEDTRFLTSGSIVRLVHQATGRNLHSHNIPAPVTKENLEISGYGNDTVGDSNDYWIVEVVDDMVSGKKGKRGDRVHALTTRMRLRHLNLGCYMRAANAILPQWGWKQVEVSCDKENNPKDEHTYWNIETHVNDKLPMGNAKLYRSPFLRDFVHLNVAMMTSNNALIPDQDKEDILASKPYDWPWLYNGLRMNGWGDGMTKYYLMGNPIIWWGATASLFVYALVYLWYSIRMQRRIVDLSPQDWDQFTFVGKFAAIGFAFQWLPFVLMKRVCYIHHFLTALLFSVVLFAHLLDHFVWNSSTARYGRGKVKTPFSELTRNVTFIAFISLVAGVFWWFRETAWGMDGSAHERWGIKWRASWNIQD